MITSYKSRQINYNKKVKVYRNLHNKTYSIQQNGLVVAHATELALHDVRLVSRPAGREKVRREGVKNVHAYLVGRIVDHRDKKPFHYSYRVTYNPYEDDSFMMEHPYGERKHSIRSALNILINEKGVWTP